MRTDERLIRIAEVTVDPDQVDLYRAALRREIEASLANEPGVLKLDAVELIATPGAFRLLEVYANRVAYERHITSPHFLAYKAETAGMVTTLVLHDAAAIALAG